MTIREWFRQAFGESAIDQVVCENPEYILDTEYVKVWLGSSEKTGALQGTCGGDVIAYFKTTSVSGAKVLLVRDNSAGHAWEVDRRATPGVYCYPPKPHAVLKLVMSV